MRRPLRRSPCFFICLSAIFSLGTKIFLCYENWFFMGCCEEVVGFLACCRAYAFRLSLLGSSELPPCKGSVSICYDVMKICLRRLSAPRLLPRLRSEPWALCLSRLGRNDKFLRDLSFRFARSFRYASSPRLLRSHRRIFLKNSVAFPPSHLLRITNFGRSPCLLRRAEVSSLRFCFVAGAPSRGAEPTLFACLCSGARSFRLVKVLFQFAMT